VREQLAIIKKKYQNLEIVQNETSKMVENQNMKLGEL
jgi:hypothetical protein